MLRRTTSLLASLAVAAALCGAPEPAGAQTAPPVLVETPGPLGSPPPVTAPAPATVPPNPPPLDLRSCAPSDLALREVGKTHDAHPAGWIYAVKNHTGSACRIVGSPGLRLFDASGKELPLKFAPRTMMAMLLTLAPGAEASFTVSYGPQHGTNTATDCKRAARIEAFFPDERSPLSAKSTLPACAGLLVNVSNLRLVAVSEIVPTPAALVS
jgi:Protein of unknown function (DUF4232)